MTPVTIRNDYDTSYSWEWFIIVLGTLIIQQSNSYALKYYMRLTSDIVLVNFLIRLKYYVVKIPPYHCQNITIISFKCWITHGKINV